MKLLSPDGTLLMEIHALKPHARGILVEGVIMGAMPMHALLTAEEMRSARKLIRWGLVRKLVLMLLSRSNPRTDPNKTGTS